MLRSPAAFALAAAIAGLMAASPAAAQSVREIDRQMPAPCRVAMNAERTSCQALMGRGGYPVPPVMRAILFGPAWNMPMLSEASGRTADAPQRREPAFVRPVVLH